MARAKDSNSHLSHKFLARIAIPGWSPSLVLLLVAPLPWASRLPDNKQGVWCGVLSQGYQAKQRWLSTKYSTCNACFPPYASPSWLTMLNKGKEKVSVAGGKDSIFENSQMQLTLSRRWAIFLEYTDPHIISSTMNMQMNYTDVPLISLTLPLSFGFILYIDTWFIYERCRHLHHAHYSVVGICEVMYTEEGR